MWYSNNNDFDQFRRITGCNDYRAYLRFEFLSDVLFGFVAAALFLAGCIGYIVYRLWQEISLEISFQKQYGADWQNQYERYHGSLAHAHSRLLIASLGLIALCAIFGWLIWQRLKRHRSRRHISH